jgi:hypothetical protein
MRKASLSLLALIVGACGTAAPPNVQQSSTVRITNGTTEDRYIGQNPVSLFRSSASGEMPVVVQSPNECMQVCGQCDVHVACGQTAIAVLPSVLLVAAGTTEERVLTGLVWQTEANGCGQGNSCELWSLGHENLVARVTYSTSYVPDSTAPPLGNNLPGILGPAMTEEGTLKFPDGVLELTLN